MKYILGSVKPKSEFVFTEVDVRFMNAGFFYKERGWLPGKIRQKWDSEHVICTHGGSAFEPHLIHLYQIELGNPRNS